MKFEGEAKINLVGIISIMICMHTRYEFNTNNFIIPTVLINQMRRVQRLLSNSVNNYLIFIEYTIKFTFSTYNYLVRQLIEKIFRINHQRNIQTINSFVKFIPLYSQTMTYF